MVLGKFTDNFLAEHVFAPEAFEADQSLYPYLQMQRRGWNFGGRTEDPKPQNTVLGIQASAVSMLLSANTLNRISSSTLYGNKYEVDEVLSDLVDACFNADWSGELNLCRQNLQTMVVNRLISVAVNKSGRYDNASSAAALAELRSLSKQLKRKKGNGLTKAHRQKLRHLIESSLEMD